MTQIRRTSRIIVGILAAVAAMTVGVTVSATGWLAAIALALGMTAYAAMAMNIFLGLRRPIVERLAGPLDQVRGLHRTLGILLTAAIAGHMILIPIASLVDRGINILDNPGPPLMAGILGLLLTVGSIVLAMNRRIPYDRWVKVHGATVIAFLILTLHTVLSSILWGVGDLTVFVTNGVFAAVGVLSVLLMALDRFRGGAAYTVASVTRHARSVEVVLAPAGAKRLRPHRVGQFVLLTAQLDGDTGEETHPFTVTASAGSERLSVLIRDAGDWTHRAQNGLVEGSAVRLRGPFGGFTPQDPQPDRPQVWVAAGSGITPFLSALRTAAPDAEQPVRLVYLARNASDAPALTEVCTRAETLPWLSLRTRFSEQEGRADGAAVVTAAGIDPREADWFLCGPGELVAALRAELLARGAHAGHIHSERYAWRDSAPVRTPEKSAVA
ncbi:MAG: ferric reductase-like transmembrane domain-containing protein [Actinobacteria bacterium]|nr:ferric reductase-like transmembrane domain-containing protein [Actinomycetota bacterium]